MQRWFLYHVAAVPKQMREAMTDIVERLRDLAEYDLADAATRSLAGETADEIERLRAVIDLAAKSLTAACLWRKYEDQK